MKLHLKNPGDAGSAFLEVLFVVSVLSILVTAAVFHGSNLYRNAILNYETQLLISDLKLFQEMSKTATYDQTNFPMKGSAPSGLVMSIYWDSYRIHETRGQFRTIRFHKFPKTISVSPVNLSYLFFRPNGDTRDRKMGSIYLHWREDYSLSRRIVIDTAGRIRVDR